MALDQPRVAYVWIWLPHTRQPVVAGRLDLDGRAVTFTYASSYLKRPERIAIYHPELPLGPTPQRPELMTTAGSIADAGPDGWGRRVIETRLLRSNIAPNIDFGDLVYLLESASDRIGALDFQSSPTEYRPRDTDAATLVDLLRVAEAVAAGDRVPAALRQALWNGTAIGGARPKALLQEGDRALIAKFGISTDAFPNVKGEFVAMELARLAQMNVAGVELASAAEKDVLLVERFDRPGDGTRRAIVSARTMLRLTETGIGASYADLADLVRARFTEPTATLRELFARITFNVLCGNVDDHARNHAAFWDGSDLSLTPAYDISPEQRPEWEANQAMAIGHDGFRASQLLGCVERAGTYHLSGAEARAVIDHQIATIKDQWDDVCERARLSADDAERLRNRQFLHPYAMEGY